MYFIYSFYSNAYSKKVVWHSESFLWTERPGPKVFWDLERNIVHTSGLDEDISTKFGIQIHHGHLEMTFSLHVFDRLSDENNF